MLKLNENTTLVRNDIDFISSTLGDEIVLMNINNGDYITMNEMGTHIWDLLKAPARISEIVEKIIKAYDVDEEQGRKKLSAFLLRMLEHNVVYVSNS